MPENSAAIFKTKRAYGVLRYYPMNAKAEQVCKLLRYETLRIEQVQSLQALGVEIIISI